MASLSADGTPFRGFLFADLLRIVTHCVTHDVSGNSDWWRTQCDNSPAEDAMFLTNDGILGRVVLFIPAFGTAIRVVTQPIVLAFLISFSTLLVVAFPPRTTATAGGKT